MSEFMNVKQRKERKVEITGQVFDCGFIPAGVEIPLLEEFNAQVEKQGSYKLPKNVAKLSTENLMKARAASAMAYVATHTKETRMDNIKFASIFTSFFNPDYDEEYLSKHASGREIDAVWKALEVTIVEDYYGTVKDLNGDVDEKKAVASAETSK